MSTEQQQLQVGIQALEGQRALLGDAVVDTAIAGLRARLDALNIGAAPPTEPAQTLKQVTILFLDVVGSTALAQHLDPEAISAVMDDALARGTALVERHAGKVLQYAGDNILAAFGNNVAREDDAERAVHCGLALLELGRTLGSEVQSRYGHAGFNVRVGIHTGGVLLGGGVDAEGSIRGIAVHIAARMEQTAPAGALRISHDTYAQVRGLFDVKPQEPLAVKGVDAPVQSYLVARAKPRQFRIDNRGIEGVATCMIGRDAEFETLRGAFKRLFEARTLAAVTVVAEAGIGKSRLLYEFQAWSETRPESFFLFKGRSTPSTGTQAYGLLRELFAWRFQIRDDDSVDAAREKMEAGMVPLFLHDDGADLAEGHTHLLAHLIGIDSRTSRHLSGILDDPRQIRNRAFHAAAQVIRRIGERDGSPVVMQIEDLHWADDESLDFLNYLAEVNRDAPILLLASTRPTLFERRKDWSSTMGSHQRIDLHPLGKDMSRLLANELLKRIAEVPAALRELLISSAEGNPFYMEELVRMLIDQGAILTGADGGESWHVNAERLLLTKVPPTLTGVLQARLDRLPAPEKRALQQASVVGVVFWDQALAAVEAQAAEQLPALVQRELTLPRPDAPLDGLREYAFAHQILHQVTYDTVLKRDKREGHASVARWFANLTHQGSLRAGDFLGLAAQHFEEAGDEASAAEFHARAAEQAGQRLAHERVLEHALRALALCGEGGQAELRWRVLRVRESTLYLQARRDQEAADLDALAQLAEAFDDDGRRAEVAWRRSNRAMRMADWPAQECAATDAMVWAERAGDDRLRLLALRMVAAARLQRSQVDAGRALALQGLAEARRLGLQGVEARLLNTLSIAAERQGDLVGVLEMNRQVLAIHREAGDRVNEAIGQSNLGVAAMLLGDLDLATRELEAALRLLRSNGDRVMEGLALGTAARLALWRGEETRALSLARQALEIAVGSRARDMEMLAALVLGQAELGLGRTAAARQAFAQAQRRGEEIGDPSRFDACAGLARVALAEDDVAAACAALQPVLDHTEGGGTLEGTSVTREVEWSCHQVLARASDPRAAGWLEHAHRQLMAQAETIPDAKLRQGFLRTIPHHREIVAAWARRAL